MAASNDDYCYDPDYYTREFFMRYIVFVSDDDRLVNGVRSNGEVTFGNIEITTSLTSCLSEEDIFFSLDDCTADNFLAAVLAEMETTAACANKHFPFVFQSMLISFNCSLPELNKFHKRLILATAS